MPTRFVFIACQHMPDPAFWRGDVLACGKLYGVDLVLDDGDFPLVSFAGQHDDLERALVLQILSRSCMVKEILECDSRRFASLESLLESGCKPFEGQAVLHFLGHRPRPPFDAAQIQNLLHFHEAWLVKTGDGWCLRQGQVIGQGCRELLTRYSLKTRQYLGPTSLTSEMAFLMANQALARPGMLVLDPFFGTGGALIACAHYGTVAVGCEIDWRMTSEAKCNQTFDQYALPRPDVVRGDFSALGKCLRARPRVLDAIVGDPPYGVRAGARKSGASKQVSHPDAAQMQSHVAGTQAYSGDDVLRDLLDAAVELLVPQGRLVFLFPIESEKWRALGVRAFPPHDGLAVISCAEQPIQGKMCRVLVTMERCDADAHVRQGDGGDAAAAKRVHHAR